MQSKRFQCQVNITDGYVVTCKKPTNYGAKHKITGYHIVNLKEKGSRFFAPYYVHRIVWEVANGVPVPKGMCVHHIDSDKSNNKISNLSVCTPKLNNFFAAKNRCYKSIYEKRKRNGFKVRVTATGPKDEKLEFPSMTQCAKHFGCNPGTISSILAGKKYYDTVTLDGQKYNISRTQIKNA